MGSLNVKGHLWVPADGAVASFHATKACERLRALTEGGRGRRQRVLWEDARSVAASAGCSTVRRCGCMSEWADRGGAGNSVRTVGGGLPTLGRRRR